MSICFKKIILFTLLFISTSLFANVAKVVAFKGEATIIRDGSYISLRRDSKILKKDEIHTKDNTKVQLIFRDNTIISIGKNSTFIVSDYLFDQKSDEYKADFSMLKGTFRTITGKIGEIAPKRFNLKTKSASIGIRGTQIVMNLSSKTEQIFCTEGEIFVQKFNSDLGSLVQAGEFVALEESKDSFTVRKIDKKELNKINKNISMEKNKARDNISLKPKQEVQNSPLQSIANSQVKTKDNKEDSNESNENTNSSLTITESVKENEKNQENQNLIDDEKKKKDEKEALEEKDRIAALEEIEKNKNDQLEKEQEDKLAQETEKEEAKRQKEEAESIINDNSSTADEKLLAEEKLREAINFKRLSHYTSKDYFQNNNSKARYKGNFNAYSYDKDSQYIKKFKYSTAIPKNSTISMDVDFGKSTKQITNGRIEINDSHYLRYYDTTYLFKGDIEKDDNEVEFKLKGIGNTIGKGEGTFFGKEANSIKGEVDFINTSLIKIEAQFDANKEGFYDEDFITIEDITPESYFDDTSSIATYKGDFNRYSYNKDDQYVKVGNGTEVKIPLNTSISMDIDFGKDSNHISNGKIVFEEPSSLLQKTISPPEHTFTFDGHIIDNAEFKLNGIGNTNGEGEGKFYGPNADLASGDVDFQNGNAEIKGTFEATKQ